MYQSVAIFQGKQDVGSDQPPQLFIIIKAEIIDDIL